MRTFATKKEEVQVVEEEEEEEVVPSPGMNARKQAHAPVNDLRNWLLRNWLLGGSN